MFPYIVVFLISIFCSYIAQSSKNKSIGFIFNLLAVLIPSILAGCRDTNIGTDVEVYGVQVFNASVYSSSVSEMVDLNPNIDYLFLVLSYFSNILFGDISGFLFAISLLTIGIAYKAFLNLKGYLPITYTYAIYLFLFYNISLNLMRQCLAISLVLIAVSYLLLNKKGMCISFFILAFCAHQTSFVAVLIVFLHWIVNTPKIYKKIVRLYIISLPLLLLLYDVLLKLFIDIGIVSSKFNIYLSEESEADLSIILILVYLIYTYISYRFIKLHKDSDSSFNFLIVYTASMCSLLSAISVWGGRVAYYFQAVILITLPHLLFRHKNISRYYKNILLVTSIFYWFIRIVYWKEMDTIPYTSNILGI